jgi:subfamily B ATP-binding cassette protein MsbA
MEIIKAFSSEDFEAERFQRDNLEFRRINMRGVRTRELTSPLVEFIGSIAAALVIWFGGQEIIKGNLSTGDFMRFAGALFALYTPMKRISVVYNRTFEAVAASERIFDMLSRVPSIKSGGTSLDGPISSLVFDDVHLAYGDTEALRGVALEVAAGDTVALVGDSGGGKTSLVSLILRLYDPTSGALRINGIATTDLDIRDLRSRIGFVTQRVFVFNDTVAANVAYGRQVDRQRVIQALDRAGALGFVSSLENGIDTVLDEFGANLSGGQRQRLAIARALYSPSEILILDEATSALDNRAEAAFQSTLRELIRDKITLIIAHRLSTVDLADRIVVVEGGRVVGQGTREQLLSDCPEFRRLVEAGARQGDSATD